MSLADCVIQRLEDSDRIFIEMSPEVMNSEVVIPKTVISIMAQRCYVQLH